MLETLAGAIIALLLLPPLLLGIGGLLLMVGGLLPENARLARAIVRCPATQKAETIELASPSRSEPDGKVTACSAFRKPAPITCEKCPGLEQVRWVRLWALCPRWSLTAGGLIGSAQAENHGKAQGAEVQQDRPGVENVSAQDPWPTKRRASMRKLASIVVFTAVAALSGYARADGAETFSKKCATCHGKDGKGKTQMGEKLKVRDLSDPAVQAKIKDDEMEKQINEGTKDKQTGKERMPAFKGKLTPAEIKDVIKFVHTLKP